MYLLLEAINVLKQVADEEGKPYVVSDGAMHWDPYNLTEAIMEGIMEEDDADDADDYDGYPKDSYYDHTYAVDRCGDSFAVFDVREDGYISNIPRYKVMWI